MRLNIVQSTSNHGPVVPYNRSVGTVHTKEGITKRRQKEYKTKKRKREEMISLRGATSMIAVDDDDESCHSNYISIQKKYSPRNSTGQCSRLASQVTCMIFRHLCKEKPPSAQSIIRFAPRSSCPPRSRVRRGRGGRGLGNRAGKRANFL